MQKITTLICGLTLSFTALFAQADVQPLQLEGITTVSAEQLIELAETEAELVIVDSRKRNDYNKGHLPDVEYLLNTNTNPGSLATIVASLDTPVCFYCNGPKCARSGDAAMKAVAAGYNQVYWFRGGIEEWNDKGYALEK